jgi:hypothetical protein
VRIIIGIQTFFDFAPAYQNFSPISSQLLIFHAHFPHILPEGKSRLSTVRTSSLYLFADSQPTGCKHWTHCRRATSTSYKRIRLVAAQSLRPAASSLVDSMIPPGTVDYQLSADWDLYMQAVRGTDSTVAFKSMTSSVSIAVHVLIHTGVAHVPRFLVRMLLPLRAQNSRSYLRSANKGRGYVISLVSTLTSSVRHRTGTGTWLVCIVCKVPVRYSAPVPNRRCRPARRYLLPTHQTKNPNLLIKTLTRWNACDPNKGSLRNPNRPTNPNPP